jgi:uncharacterized membrane protein
MQLSLPLHPFPQFDLSTVHSDCVTLTHQQIAILFLVIHELIICLLFFQNKNQIKNEQVKKTTTLETKTHNMVEKERRQINQD